MDTNTVAALTHSYEDTHTGRLQQKQTQILAYTHFGGGKQLQIK